MSLPVERGVEIQAGVQGQSAVIPPTTAELMHTRRSPWEFPASTPDGNPVWWGLDQRGINNCIHSLTDNSRDFRRVFDPPKA